MMGKSAPKAGTEAAAGSEDRAETRRDLPPAARRALAEAAQRREANAAAEAARAREIGGRGGLEPVRYGDWEIKGKAVDF